jgi:hypothetical protein
MKPEHARVWIPTCLRLRLLLPHEIWGQLGWQMRGPKGVDAAPDELLVMLACPGRNH